MDTLLPPEWKDAPKPGPDAVTGVTV